MIESGTFNRLASGLSLEERKQLLEKLSGVSTAIREPLYESSPEAPVIQAADLYAGLPWYVRLWYFIQSVFLSRPPVKIFEDRRIAGVGRGIEERWPGIYAYQRELLLPGFHAAMVELKEGARFFYTALDSSVNQDKGAFYAFLGSLEMGGIHSRLQSGTDPERIAGEKPGISAPELRQEALRVLDEIMGDISTGDREAMYANVRALLHLKELASFLFDRVIMVFTFDHGAAGQTCPVRLVRDLLSTLNNILYSLRDPPSPAVLESMFVFILQEKAGAPGFDPGREIQALLAQAEEALLRIKGFNRQIPLTPILRCAHRNIALTPKTITGGEDWFALYQDYWKRYTETRLGEYLGGRRRRELLKLFGDFFKGAPLVPLPNVLSETDPGGFPLKGAFALSFLLTFRKEIFLGSESRILKPVLDEGEFVRRENRTEFTERYAQILKWQEDITILGTDISPEGSFGKRYAQIRGDMSSLAAKRRKTQVVLDEAAAKARAIVDAARASLKGMAGLLNGILTGDGGGKYGPLSNQDGPGAGDIPTTDLIAAFQKFQRALKVLDEIDLMEAGK